MNIARRKRISAVMDRLEEIMDEVGTILEEEQNYLDNIPENLQTSERYEIAENAVSELEDAETSLRELFEALENAKE